MILTKVSINKMSRGKGSFGMKFLFDIRDLMRVIHLGNLSLFSKSTSFKGPKLRIGK